MIPVLTPQKLSKLIGVLCWQSVPGEVEQIQPVLSGAGGQQGGLQHTGDRAECRGEGAAGAQSGPTFQGSDQWSHQLRFQ